MSHSETGPCDKCGGSGELQDARVRQAICDECHGHGWFNEGVAGPAEQAPHEFACAVHRGGKCTCSVLDESREFILCGKCKNRWLCEERGCIDKAKSAPAPMAVLTGAALVMGEAIENAHPLGCEERAAPVVSNGQDHPKSSSGSNEQTTRGGSIARGDEPMGEPNYYAHRIERSLDDLPDEEHIALHRGFLADTAKTIRRLIKESERSSTDSVTTHRACGVCGVRDIPRGVDWPFWKDGKPIHSQCTDGVAPASSVASGTSNEGEK